MAECSLATLRGQHQGRWTWSSSKLSLRNMSIMDPKRNYALKIHLPCQSRAAREWTSVLTPFGFRGRDHRVETSVKCYCLQPLVDSESMVSPNLILFSDEALLTISMVFAYLAGVVPSGQTSPHVRNQNVFQHIPEPSSSHSGRDLKFLPERNAAFDPSDMWSEVRAKLSRALQAHVQDASLDSREDELTSDRKNYPLSMLAILAGPRLRLLLITFQLLEMEVRNIFGSSELVDGIRSDSYFDVKFLAEHGERILEDLVISLADVIASIYLELMSVDGDMSTEVVSSSLVLCSLSTRELQKLRNEGLNPLGSMRKSSRFELYVLCSKKCEKTDNNQAERANWWRIAFGKPNVLTLDYVNISPFSLPARRTKELRALIGWRYYFSLFLELSDISMPFIGAAISKVSAAVSYFWVSMIGRSLGLIFSGIRQSLGWK
ncbi:unnamed protein product [Miscanthus lutarioriparius]|uniref:Uncharacterized protein n=1 Tax=Miscanthus lutarioriparius TaxID=422564 RepID=A0A811PBD5_9POAL|nr:unnamed protein product [Miscanthus lutarioriparius]